MTPRGFTLVELLLAMLLGSFLVAATLSAFAQGRTLYQRSERLARLHERALYVFSVLEPDLQLAGYYGFHTSAAGMLLPTSLPDPSGCGVALAARFGTSIAASDQRYALRCPANGGGAAESADTLTVRRVEVESAARERGRLQVFSNRLSPAAQQLFTDGSTASTLQPGLRELRNLVVHNYYIARKSDGEDRSGGVTLPALRVKSLSSIAGSPAFIDTEVMNGIEDLQVELGYVEAAAEVAAPRYVSAGNVPAGAQIVAVRIWLRLRSEDGEPGYRDARRHDYANQSYVAADHFQRLLVSRTIQLRNAGT